jgi:riboflavin kinase/FMN adenylyltransferase
MNASVLQGLESLGDEVRGCVLTIGNFDGVHRGHQRIVRAAREIGDAEKRPVVAMTFEPAPMALLAPDKTPPRLTPPDQKQRLLAASGADFVAVVPTTRAFLSTPPEAFIDEILVGRFAARHVVEGNNFFFGANRAGNVETLRAAQDRCGFEVHVVDPFVIRLDGEVQRVSSSLTRRLIRAGRVAEAAVCLDRPYAVFGHVIRGTGRGRTLLNFPTVNLRTEDQLLPHDGIYAGYAETPPEVTDAAAAISIGENPTLGGHGRTVEAFVIDREGTFYDRRAALHFVERLRDQKKFESVEALREAIGRDVEHVRRILK